MSNYNRYNNYNKRKNADDSNDCEYTYNKQIDNYKF